MKVDKVLHSVLFLGQLLRYKEWRQTGVYM